MMVKYLKNPSLIGIFVGILIGWKFPIFFGIAAFNYCFIRWLEKDIAKHEDILATDVKELKSIVSKINFASNLKSFTGRSP